MKVIELTKGQVAIVDDEDFDRLAQYRWHLNGAGYPTRSASIKGGQRRRNIRMHQEIMSAPDGYEIDHRNGNPLDNRRCNLRIATKIQNSQNRKAGSHNKLGIKGVHFNAQRKKFEAFIQPATGKRKWLGRFATVEEAKAAYNAAAIELHGEFARLN